MGETQEERARREARERCEWDTALRSAQVRVHIKEKEQTREQERKEKENKHG